MTIQRFNNRVVRFHFFEKLRESHAGWVEYDPGKKELRLFADNQHVLRFNILKVSSRPSRSVPGKTRVFFNTEGARADDQGRLSIKATPSRIGMLTTHDEAFELLTARPNPPVFIEARNSPIQGGVKLIPPQSLYDMYCDTYRDVNRLIELDIERVSALPGAGNTLAQHAEDMATAAEELDDNFELNAKLNVQRFLAGISSGSQLDAPWRYRGAHGWNVRKVCGLRPRTGNYIMCVFGTKQALRQIATLPLLEFDSRSGCRNAADRLSRYFPDLMVSVCYVSQVWQERRLIEREMARRD